MFRLAPFVALTFISSAAASDIVSGADKKSLLFEIVSNWSLPTAYLIYSQDAGELSDYQIDWRDVAVHHASCQSKELNKHATLTDLEVIRFIWIENRGRENRAARKVKRSLSSGAYSQASAALAGSFHDCMIETMDFVRDLKNE